MASRLICPKGHSWAAPDSGAATACPVCGSRGREAISEQTFVNRSVLVGAEQTLPTPLPDPPRREVAGRAIPPAEVTAAAPRRVERSLAAEATEKISGQRGSAAGTTAPLPTDPGAYTILRQHAEGGLGIVSLARDVAVQRDVALKQIQPQLADDPLSRQRFLHEARVTGQLEHPGIVPVYALGADEAGRPHYAMKFIRGRTFDEHLSDYALYPNALVFRELLRRFVAICQTIAYAHSRGIIHRDIKPSNLMLGDYGETLVLDWGLAKDISDRAGRSAEAGTVGGAGPPRPRVRDNELTRVGQVIGTPAYMAPEQAAGDTGKHGPCTDIYALGAVLYKLLTGKTPSGTHAAADGQTMIYQAPPAPHTVNPRVPVRLEMICLKAMALRPEERQQRAMELADEVQRFLDENPLQPVISRWRQARIFLKKHAVMVGFWGLLNLAALFGLAALLSALVRR